MSIEENTVSSLVGIILNFVGFFVFFGFFFWFFYFQGYKNSWPMIQTYTYINMVDIATTDL